MAKDVKDLKTCILGAGMGGLTCALALAREGFRNIEVYEYASSLGFVGAGIQLAPNMARVLDNMGVWKEIADESVVVKETSIRDGAKNEELAHVNLGTVESQYGYSHRVGHRASLAASIYAGCQREAAIKFIFSTTAEDADVASAKPSFRAVPRDGSPPYRVEADVLLGADGVKSNTRVSMLDTLGVTASVVDTGQAAYRIMLTKEQMGTDAELLSLISGSTVTRWIGERRHIIAYPVSSNTIYNISTVQPDANFAAAPSATYTTRGDKGAMLGVFADFCPMVQRMLDLVPEGEVCEWKLRVHEPLPTWVHGRTALVGDACHPTLPHLAQGAAQAIEDGAVLGVVLGALPDAEAESINRALRVYEGVRKERAETLVAIAAASGRGLHLGEGAAKEERDRQFRELKEKGGSGPVPDKWADPETQRMVYAFDCVAAARKAAREAFAEGTY